MGESGETAPREELRRSRLSLDEIIEAASLRHQMYGYAMTKLGDDPNPMAETLLSFLEHERDAWLDLLPEEQKTEMLMNEINEEGEE